METQTAVHASASARMFPSARMRAALAEQGHCPHTSPPRPPQLSRNRRCQRIRLAGLAMSPPVRIPLGRERSSELPICSQHSSLSAHRLAPQPACLRRNLLSLPPLLQPEQSRHCHDTIQSYAAPRRYARSLRGTAGSPLAQPPRGSSHSPGCGCRPAAPQVDHLRIRSLAQQSRPSLRT